MTGWDNSLYPGHFMALKSDMSDDYFNLSDIICMMTSQWQ